MQETISSFFEAIKERFTSPLVGCFILSWLFFNYQIIFVTFSTISFYEKIEFIENYFYLEWRGTPNRIIYYPALSCVLYFTLFKLVDLAFYYLSLLVNKAQNFIHNQVKMNELITREEYAELRAKYRDFEYKKQEEIEKLERNKSEYEELYNDCNLKYISLRNRFLQDAEKLKVYGVSAYYSDVLNDEDFSDVSYQSSEFIGFVIKHQYKDTYMKDIYSFFNEDDDNKILAIFNDLEHKNYLVRKNETLDGNFKIELGERGKEFMIRFKG